MNIRFTYLYRDGGNYKRWGNVVFRDPDDRSLVEIEERLRSAFIPGEFFNAEQAGVPMCFLYVTGEATEDDVCFHEFYAVERTEDVANDAMDRSIGEFLDTVQTCSATGWKAFVPD